MKWRVTFDDLPTNGLRVYSFCDHASHVSGVGVCAGGAHDPKGKHGLAHFTEHVLSRCSTVHDDDTVRMRCVRHMGSPDDDINIRTDNTTTLYGTGMLLARRYAANMFDVFAQLVHPATNIFNMGSEVLTQRFLSEKAAVHEEYYSRGIDEVQGEARQLFYRTLYRTNPIRQRVDCEEEDLRGMTPDDVKKFFKRYYRPQNMFAVVFGVPFAHAKEMAARYLSDWPDTGPAPLLRWDRSDRVPSLRSIRSEEVVREGVHQHHFVMGFPTEGYETSDDAALDALAWILEHRLYAALREGNIDFNGGVYRVHVTAERTFLQGSFTVQFATLSKIFMLAAEKRILEEFDRLKRELVSPAEIEMARGRMLDVHYGSFRTSALTLSENIAEARTCGDPDLIQFHAFPERVRQTSRRKLLAVANKYFDTKAYARAVISPAHPLA